MQKQNTKLTSAKNVKLMMVLEKNENKKTENTLKI